MVVVVVVMPGIVMVVVVVMLVLDVSAPEAGQGETDLVLRSRAGDPCLTILEKE